ncbi:LIPASE-LIKE PAD4 [Salix viminalis]|uniref:LIPASE-LIKE PAD4 n=1 Tax=Salix viminalis TaxID=40686 RepID=A0A9Q0UWC3_SALVM|nr:LIPASE-LIKE PAD4 [Salix viminalis]
MDTETSSFETSEMLGTFLASTPLLSESWRLCDLANANSPQSFVVEQVGSIGYVAFSGIQPVSGSDPSFRNLVPLPDVDIHGVFNPLHRQSEEEEPVMVQGALLRGFENIYNNTSFQIQMNALIQTSKSIIFTGHSVGGTTASIAALWLLSFLHSKFLNVSVLCITFGSPLLGNESLSRAILREKWGGKFCHVVSKYDIMPRMLFAPMDPIAPHIKPLLQFWHWYMKSPPSGMLAVPLSDEILAQIFQFILAHLRGLAEAGEEAVAGTFRPFGNYIFCSEDGAVCVDNAASVVKMMYLLLTMGSPSCSGELPESSYEAGVELALQSLGIPCKEPVAGPAMDCLKAARQMGRTPNLNCANLAIKLSKINPYRAEIEWYKAFCDRSDDQMGYYDSFKQRGASKRDSKVNLNRHKLARFWDNVINLFESNQLPHDFHRQKKWVNASQFYKLLVEPLDIAEYYRTGMHRSKGHYIKHGRERRYRIFDSWWKETSGSEKGNKRSRFASLTQYTCFWAEVEEARDRLDALRSTSDPRQLALYWQDIDRFARCAKTLVENKEVSIDVVAKNSSYSLWLRDYNELKSQMEPFRPQFFEFWE